MKAKLPITLAVASAFVASGCTPAGKANAPAPAPAVEKTAEASPQPATPYSVDDWWPNRLDLSMLANNENAHNPMGDEFNYAEAFAKLDLPAVKKDVAQVLTDSQDWWPADYGTYGGLMIRLAWHSAGTYRVTDGRGGSAMGTIRFAPLNSWPDNANLDKARRLLWPVKKKYGRSLSWADLMILAGNVAFESMGFQTFGFAGGREDVFVPEDIYWGPETEMLADNRFTKGDKSIKHGLGASQMGLIYVNPEGPRGNSDPLSAANHIRLTFGRMAMNDEETVALIAGGHTLGKAHGAASAAKHVGAEPEAGSVDQQGFGWKNTYGSGKGKDTITSGLEGAWTFTPNKWSHGYFANLFEYEWELIEGPGGARQWQPTDATSQKVPDAHVAGKYHRPMMLTTDIALVKDPAYRAISERFYKDPKAFEDAFARAWFKLTHRDMGPHARLVGSEVPPPQPWQDPVPAVDHPLVGEKEIAELKEQILASGLTAADLVGAAWASASTYRDSDKRGGANGARVRLAPAKDWKANNPAQLARVLGKLEEIQRAFNRKGAKKISMADLIVLGGATAIEEASRKAGVSVTVPFAPGRSDATQDMTDVGSYAHLEPKADGFRNFIGEKTERSPAERLIDKADLLTLSAPEMTVLVGGMRVLGTNSNGSAHGVFTDRVGTLSNDFFVNLMDMSVEWGSEDGDVFQGKNRETGEVVRTATAVDLLFGSNSQLRGISEVYAGSDANEKFVKDFVAAWTKVMQLDRFDLTGPNRAILTQR
ncbi:MAG: catalase/peroxidase HPI [Myxococcota bacterium]